MGGQYGLENCLVFVWPVESYVRRRPHQSIHLLLWGLPEADKLRVWRWRIFSAGSGHVDRGEQKTFMRTSDAGRWLRSRFCPECGSTVYWEAEFRPGIIGVAIGALADAEDLQPVAVVWTKQKHAWAPIPTDIPAYETQP